MMNIDGYNPNPILAQPEWRTSKNSILLRYLEAFRHCSFWGWGSVPQTKTLSSHHDGQGFGYLAIQYIASYGVGVNKIIHTFCQVCRRKGFTYEH